MYEEEGNAIVGIANGLWLVCVAGIVTYSAYRLVAWVFG